MFCKQCGTNMGNNAFCPNCNRQAAITTTPPTFNGEMGISFADSVDGAMAIPAQTSSNSGFFKTKKKIWIPLLVVSLALIHVLAIVLLFVLTNRVSDDPYEVAGNLRSAGYEVEITDEEEIGLYTPFSGVQYIIRATNIFDENDMAIFLFCDSRDTARSIAKAVELEWELMDVGYLETVIVDYDGAVAYIGTVAAIDAAK
ncbi:MAG: zinc ribbon domain-containing protein [Clostridiales bacterium]|nr:zinc ribbon domain-containing protein [Clostridiales bacterium]